MAEYWKSTPKYWCTVCKVFVKDTKLERTGHEAGPRHQGNLQRSLRRLHIGHERESREKQRAKDELDRLNGVRPVGRGPFRGQGGRTENASSSESSRTVDPAERKKQLAQLASMGVAVPEEFRREMAMAGDWQVTNQRVIEEQTGDEPRTSLAQIKQELAQEDSKTPQAIPSSSVAATSQGVRKRKIEIDQEDQDEVDRDSSIGHIRPKVSWGRTTREFPPNAQDPDLDALLMTTKVISKNQHRTAKELNTSSSDQTSGAKDCVKEEDVKQEMIKQEDVELEPGKDNRKSLTVKAGNDQHNQAKVKTEDDQAGTSAAPLISFKKRKSKAIRQQ